MLELNQERIHIRSQSLEKNLAHTINSIRLLSLSGKPILVIAPDSARLKMIELECRADRITISDEWDIPCQSAILKLASIPHELNALISLNDENTLEKWQFDTEKKYAVFTIQGIDHFIETFVVSFNAKMIAGVGITGKSLYLWYQKPKGLPNFYQKRCWAFEGKTIENVQFSETQELIISFDSQVSIVHMPSGTAMFTFYLNEVITQFTSAPYCGIKHKMLIMSYEHKQTTWLDLHGISQRQLNTELMGHHSPLRAIAMHFSELTEPAYVITASQDCLRIRRLDGLLGPRLPFYDKRDGQNIRVLAISSTGLVAAFNADQSRIYLWSLIEPGNLLSTISHLSSVIGLFFYVQGGNAEVLMVSYEMAEKNHTLYYDLTQRRHGIELRSFSILAWQSDLAHWAETKLSTIKEKKPSSISATQHLSNEELVKAEINENANAVKVSLFTKQTESETLLWHQYNQLSFFASRSPRENDLEAEQALHYQKSDFSRGSSSYDVQ